jgi:hypothetical protein
MSKLNNTMRVYHRYLGFFLAGIMAVYAISGTILIFRKTSFLKTEKHIEKTLSADVKKEELGKMLKIREFRVEKEENGVLFFRDGTYDTNTHIAKYKVIEIPKIIEKMMILHKSSTTEPVYLLNVFFGVALMFFVISTFWMFLPSTKIFKKGIYFTLGGILLTLILLYI